MQNIKCNMCYNFDLSVAFFHDIGNIVWLDQNPKRTLLFYSWK